MVTTVTDKAANATPVDALVDNAIGGAGGLISTVDQSVKDNVQAPQLRRQGAMAAAASGFADALGASNAVRSWFAGLSTAFAELISFVQTLFSGDPVRALKDNALDIANESNETQFDVNKYSDDRSIAAPGQTKLAPGMARLGDNVNPNPGIAADAPTPLERGNAGINRIFDGNFMTELAEDFGVTALEDQERLTNALIISSGSDLFTQSPARRLEGEDRAAQIIADAVSTSAPLEDDGFEERQPEWFERINSGINRALSGDDDLLLKVAEKLGATSPEQQQRLDDAITIAYGGVNKDEGTALIKSVLADFKAATAPAPAASAIRANFTGNADPSTQTTIPAPERAVTTPPLAPAGQPVAALVNE